MVRFVLSFGKARAAVPAFAVVAGGQLARLAAVLLSVVLTLPALAPCVVAGGVSWLQLVLYLGRVPWRALAVLLRALWRGSCIICPVLLAWPLRALRGWRWCGVGWWRVVLAAVAVRASLLTAVAVDSASVKRAHLLGPWRAWWRCAGGVVSCQ